MEATLQEVLDWAEEMERVRAALMLERGEFPGPSALCKSFDRAPMRIWRELLRLSSELLNQSGHAAIDATYFDRRQASNHYLKRCDRDVRTIQATFLVDTAGRGYRRSLQREVAQRHEDRPAGRPAQPRR